MENRNRRMSVSEQERAQIRAAKRRKRLMIAMIERIVAALIFVVVLVIIISATVKSVGKSKERKEEKEIAEQEIQNIDPLAGYTPIVSDEELVTLTEEPTIEVKQFTAIESANPLYIPGDVESANAILINMDTNEIIASKGGKDRIVPASMTKVLTVISAWKRITPEQLNESVIVPQEAIDYSFKHKCSCVGFEPGEIVTVRDLFYGTILPSGGDAAVALAIYIAGSQEEFVNMMNADLQEFGMGSTSHMMNMVGINDENHYSTCYDMAMLLERAMDDDFLAEVLSAHIYTTSSSDEHPEGLEISNWFLRRIEDKDFGGTIWGAKTGYVDESRSCSVSCEISNTGVKYLCCTAGAHNSWRCINDHASIYKNLCQ